MPSIHNNNKHDDNMDLEEGITPPSHLAPNCDSAALQEVSSTQRQAMDEFIHSQSNGAWANLVETFRRQRQASKLSAKTPAVSNSVAASNGRSHASTSTGGVSKNKIMPQASTAPMNPPVAPNVMNPPVPDVQRISALDLSTRSASRKKSSKGKLDSIQDNAQASMPVSAACHVASRPDDTHQLESVSPSSGDHMSMLQTHEAPSILFHAPEARLVVEEETADPMVYEATVVRRKSEQAETPWWKRYQGNIFIGILIVLCVIVAVTSTLLVSSKDRNEGSTSNDESGSGHLRGGEPTTNETQLFDSNSPAEIPDPSIDESSALIPNMPSTKPTGTLATKPILSANPNNITMTSQAKLVPNDGEASYFGFALAVSGNTVVTGAYKDDENGSNSGSVYVYNHDGDTWTQQAKIFPNDGEAYDEFGYAVAVSGNTVVIGVHKDDDLGSDSGSAYVYIRDGDTWSLQAKLLPNDGETNDHFGHAVGVSGDTIVVGAPYDDDNGSDSGSAYVFIRDGTTWNQQAKLLPKDGQDNDYFGKSLAVSEDTLVIGAERDNDNGIDSGSAYVFIREGGSTWHQHSKLLPNDGKEYDNFGHTVAVSEGSIVVGADGADDMVIDSGSAYVFIDNGDTWSQQAKLLPSDGQAGDNFGHAVAVSGDTVIVGAKDYHGNQNYSGAAYVYIRDGEMWNQQAKLMPNNGEDYDFGLAVAVGGDNVVIGTHSDRETDNESGSAYVFPLQ